MTRNPDAPVPGHANDGLAPQHAAKLTCWLAVPLSTRLALFLLTSGGASQSVEGVLHQAHTSYSSLKVRCAGLGCWLASESAAAIAQAVSLWEDQRLPAELLVRGLRQTRKAAATKGWEMGRSLQLASLCAPARLEKRE